MIRMFSDLQISATSLFEVLNERLQNGALDQLDERGFADCIISLRQHIAISNSAKTYRAAMIELESILNENMEIMGTDSLSDIFYIFVMTNAKYSTLKEVVMQRLEDEN